MDGIVYQEFLSDDNLSFHYYIVFTLIIMF